MKILLTSFGSRGDVYPLIYLGRELKRRGHEIVFTTSLDYKNSCEQEGFIYFPCGSSVKNIVNQFSKYINKPLKVMKEGLNIFSEEFQSLFAVSYEAAKDSDMIIASGLQLTGSIIAESLNIPYYYVAHIPALIPSKFHAPYFIPFQNLPKFINQILWKGNNFFSRLIVSKVLNEIRLSLDLDKKRNIIDHVDPDKMIIAISPELSKIPLDVKYHILQVDYFWNPDEKNLSDDVLNFIMKGEAPVYFGFGSMVDGDAEKTMEIIFDVVRTMKIRAVISKGWANYSNKDTSSDILFINDEPHGKLFPKMKAIVHHGGAGTTCCAAMAGIPQITTPHVLDQYYWTKRIKDLGIGPGGVSKRKLTKSNLINKLNRAIYDNEIIAAAKDIKGKMNRKNGIYEFADKIEGELCFK